LKNRIRHFRSLRHLRLRELAERVGTTPQTISRLETGNMTLSVDWMQKLADALEIHPADLLEQPDRQEIPLIGLVEASGSILEGPEGVMELYVPAINPVAVRLLAPSGIYKAGEILIGDRRRPGEVSDFVGRDAIVELESNLRLVAKIATPIPGAQGASLIALDGSRVHYDVRLSWAAPIVMVARYM